MKSEPEIISGQEARERLDLISRQELLDKFKDRGKATRWDMFCGYLSPRLVRFIISSLPHKDPNRHGSWKLISPAGIYECSRCGQHVMTNDIDEYKFCHKCGAKMEGVG